MKYLKWPLIIIVSLLVIYLILCALGPKNMNTQRTTEINAPAAITYNLFNNLKEWNSWSPWAALDSSMVIKHGDKTEGLGASYSWQGNPKLTGAGNMKITETVVNESTKLEMFNEDYGSSAMITFSTKQEGAKTQLTWDLKDNEDLPFLYRGMMLILGMKGKLKDNFDDGLASIKSIAEKRTEGNYNGYQINAGELGEKHYIMNRQEVAFANISEFYSGALAGLLTKALKSSVSPSGNPSGLFFKYDEQAGKTDMAAAISVSEAISIPGTMSYTIPAGPGLQIDFYGNYSNTGLAHEALDAYMKDHGLLHNAPVIEEHITDPGEEPDPAKWLTRIIYYLAQAN